MIDFCAQRVGVQLASRDVFGYRIPLHGHQRAHTPGSAAFLVGDAAGLVEPLFGEGIYYAVASAQAAAAAIVAAAAGEDDHYPRSRAPLDRDLRSWKRLADLFDAYPRASYRLACLLPARQVIMRSTALGWTLNQTLRSLPLLPFARAPRR